MDKNLVVRLRLLGSEQAMGWSGGQGPQGHPPKGDTLLESNIDCTGLDWTVLVLYWFCTGSVLDCFLKRVYFSGSILCCGVVVGKSHKVLHDYKWTESDVF